MRYLISIVMLCSLGSCECFPRTESIVLDKATGVPVDSAEVRLFIYSGVGDKPADDTVFTNNRGHLNYMIHTGFEGLGTCPTLEIEIKKEGYMPQTVTNVGLRDTIYLVSK